VNIGAFVPAKAAMALLILGIAAAGCANGGASTAAAPSPTPTLQPSESSAASPTPLDSAAANEIVVTDPTKAAAADNSPSPKAVGSTSGKAGVASSGSQATAGGQAAAAGPASVSLGTAGNYVLLSKAGISTTGTTKITGDIGVSPIAATAITGFGLVLDKSGTFSTSSVVVGEVFAATYGVPTPGLLTTAVKDMQTAYTDAAGRKAGVTELGAGNIGGLTLAPGVYKWGSNVTIPTNVTLSGGKNDVWILQIAGNLSTSSAQRVILSGGAQAKNIFWQVAGSTTLGTTSRFYGTILDKTNIALKTGAVLNGRALAQTAITLDANTQP
jgi:hypothetical protein